MKDKINLIGYTTGVFDLFHVGHLNILKRAKSQCDKLIVGVTTDELAFQLKGRKPVIPYSERRMIVESIKYVDKVIPQKEINELKDWEKIGFDVIVKGDDWKGTEKWDKLEEEFSKVGVKVLFSPYTKGTSSTFLKGVLKRI
jgi:glycerol-3-phosphate cytidylyltransferase